MYKSHDKRRKSNKHCSYEMFNYVIIPNSMLKFFTYETLWW